jgi:hypothetical protein
LRAARPAIGFLYLLKLKADGAVFRRLDSLKTAVAGRALAYKGVSPSRTTSICRANQPQTFLSPTPGARLWASL